MKPLQKAFVFALLLIYSPLHALSIMDIQGVMLQRISSFITWPQLPEQAMQVCVAGDETFIANLQQLYHDKKLHGLPIDIISIDTSSTQSTLATCQIIYLTNENSDLISNIVASVKKEGLLIVSGREQDIYKGATVALYPDNNKIKIVINKKSLQNRNLKADYRLMKLSKVVDSSESNHAAE
jgi:hypothetical protein